MEEAPADEGAAEGEERLVDVGAPFVTHEQAAVSVQPGDGALDDPAVPAEPLGGLDAASGDPGRDAASPKGARWLG